MKRKIVSSAVLAVVGAMFGSAALADNVSINATFQSGNLIENVGINDPHLAPPGAGTYGAGVYNFTVDSTNGVVTVPGGTPTSPITAAQLAAAGISNGTTFQGVCIDFTHDITNGTHTNWSVVNLTQVQASPSGINGDGNGVGITQIQALAIGDLWDAARLNAFTADTAARLQLSIWDILYDNSVGSNQNTYATPTTLFTGNNNIGNTTASMGGATKAMADAVNALALATTTYNNNHNAAPDVYAMTDLPPGTFTQDFAIVGPIPTNVVGTPLPRTATAGFSILAALAGFELLRKRQGRQQLA